MSCAGENDKLKIWILGIFHSGTTIFWKSWRKDSRFLCFDEPFNGEIGLSFPSSGSKGTHDEYMALYGDNPSVFWKMYAPIEPYQELSNYLSIDQEDYIESLINKANKVIVDETRLHHHLPTIRKISPDGYVIHLYRRASSVVTSHFLPKKVKQHSFFNKIKQQVGHMHRKHIFWNRTELPPGMDRNKVIGGNPRSKFGLLLHEAGYDVDRIMNSPALVRFLAYWHYSYHLLEKEGPEYFGNKFISISYENFATDPNAIMSQLYDMIGMNRPEQIVYSDIHLPNQSFRNNDKKWRIAAKIAGFTERELDSLL